MLPLVTLLLCTGQLPASQLTTGKILGNDVPLYGLNHCYTTELVKAKFKPNVGSKVAMQPVALHSNYCTITPFTLYCELCHKQFLDYLQHDKEAFSLVIQTHDFSHNTRKMIPFSLSTQK